MVIPVHTQHYMMLQRNLLYTAATRGKKLVVVVIGTKKALGMPEPGLLVARPVPGADRKTSGATASIGEDSFLEGGPECAMSVWKRQEV